MKAFRIIRHQIPFIALCAAFLIGPAAVPGAVCEAASGKMTIVAIDLEEENTGEATMISAADGTPLLVDSGDKHNRSVFEWLDRNGYKNKKFNTLVTHWHDDHAGNTAEIIRKYRVGTVYLPKTNYLNVNKDRSYYDYERTFATDTLRAARERGTKVVYLEKGDTIRIGSGVSGKVLYVNESPYSENWYAVQYINNQSAAIMFTGGGSKFLATGDLQEQGENRLLKSGVSLKADIYKMSHHGYDRSNQMKFIKAVSPTYAWFTTHNVTPQKYSEPNTRDGAARMGRIANTFSTRYNGTLRFVCKNGEINVSAERNTSKMYEKLISKKTGSAKYATFTFNKACAAHMTQKIVNTDLYYNRQLKAAKSGSLFTGSWKDQDGSKYLVKGNLKAFHTFAEKGGKTYYFDWSGRRKTGFINAYGGKYYFSPSMATGWKVVSGRRYYFMDSRYGSYSKAKRGRMLTGFKTIAGKKYYFMNARCSSYSKETLGKLMTGFFKVNGKSYYGANSKMEGYSKENLGVLAKGWVKIGSNRYYFGTDNVMRTGWLKLGRRTYYLFPGGSAAVNRFVTISDKKYYFDQNGVMKTGWQTIGAKKYYFDENGVMQTGWQTIDGKKYYFDENGVMLTGRQKIGDKVYVFGEDGALIGEAADEASTATTAAPENYETAPEAEPGTEGSGAAYGWTGSESTAQESTSEGATYETAAEEEQEAAPDGTTYETAAEGSLRETSGEGLTEESGSGEEAENEPETEPQEGTDLPAVAEPYTGENFPAEGQSAEP